MNDDLYVPMQVQYSNYEEFLDNNSEPMLRKEKDDDDGIIKVSFSTFFLYKIVIDISSIGIKILLLLVHYDYHYYCHLIVYNNTYHHHYYYDYYDYHYDHYYFLYLG